MDLGEIWVEDNSPVIHIGAGGPQSNTIYKKTQWKKGLLVNLQEHAHLSERWNKPKGKMRRRMDSHGGKIRWRQNQRKQAKKVVQEIKE